MLTSAALNDMKAYIRSRIRKAQYRIGTTYYDAVISDAEILESGILRLKTEIALSGPATVTQVRLISTAGEVWTQNNVNVVLTGDSPHFLQWFDFDVREGELNDVH